jgi:hypothetical protein
VAVKARGNAALAATIAIVALLLPAAAMARATPFSRGGNPTVVARLAFRGTNGYGIEVNLVNRRQLSVSASVKKRSGLLLTNYSLTAPQAPGSDDVKASLGKLGRIDVHFVRESVMRRKPDVPVCKGVKNTVETGRFVGLIEFRGDRDYTRARVTHARGSVVIEPPPSCRHQAQHKPHQRGRVEALERSAQTAPNKAAGEAHIVELNAMTSAPPVVFQAQQASLPERVKGLGKNISNFFAAASRDRGRIKESSAALNLLVSGPYFKVPDLEHLTSEAILEPPQPFLGSATFRRESATRTSWEGDLRVDLPGFGVVRLAGPDSEATMCADSGCHLPK